MFPADVGTCGGLITNEHAQVLDERDRVIDGLYAAGNITATVMGRTYLGAGGSIANTMVFGYVAARHAAAARARSGPGRQLVAPASLSTKSLGFKPDWMSSVLRA